MGLSFARIVSRETIIKHRSASSLLQYISVNLNTYPFMDSPPTPASESPAPPTFRPPHKIAPPPPDFPVPKKSDLAFQATTGLKPLVLSRRVNPLQSAQAATEVNAAARRSLHTLEAADAASLRDQPARNEARGAASEKALALLETKVAEQALALATAKNHLMERDRELAEAEALLRAREKVLDGVRKQPAATLNQGIDVAGSGLDSPQS